MNVREQEALFQRVRVRFSGQSSRWQSGYVAGVADADKNKPPIVESDGEYETGYYNGFLDADGIDILYMYPTTFADFIPEDLDFRWWEKDKT